MVGGIKKAGAGFKSHGKHLRKMAANIASYYHDRGIVFSNHFKSCEGPQKPMSRNPGNIHVRSPADLTLSFQDLFVYYTKMLPIQKKTMHNISQASIITNEIVAHTGICLK